MNTRRATPVAFLAVLPAGALFGFAEAADFELEFDEAVMALGGGGMFGRGRRAGVKKQAEAEPRGRL